jgi:hypothetical protein
MMQAEGIGRDLIGRGDEEADRRAERARDKTSLSDKSTPPGDEYSVGAALCIFGTDQR